MNESNPSSRKPPTHWSYVSCISVASFWLPHYSVLRKYQN
jgi:hypothetical protein